ncbi:MAG: rod shape-determining protein, partial [Chloroflexi bacterium]|nr:rod shape-determining protein [Chloroflexota bacterium]
IGLQGARLEADILTLTTPQGSLDALVRCVQDQGIDIQEVVFGPLAVAEATVSPGEREAGVLVIHIGTAVTTLLVFASGTLQILDQVEIGGRHITNDIAVVMQLSLRQAEHVKTTYGSAFLEHESQRMVPVPPDEGYAPAPVPEQLLSDVIRARMEEILDLSVDTLAQQIPTVALPAGIVLTGGSAHLPGIGTLARHHLGLSARVGVPRGPRDRLAPGTSWSVAVSLAQWAEKGESDLARERELLPTTRLRRVARRFLPLGGG